MKKRIFTQQGILVIAIIIIYILFSILSKRFFSLSNFYVILRSMSILTVLAAGVTFVITLGEIDLSIQTLPGLCAAVFCVLVKYGITFPLAMLAAFAVAMVFGFLNGFIIQKTVLPSIIITLATLMIAMGLTHIITQHRAVVISQKLFVKIFSGTILGFQVIVLWMIIMVVIGYLILHRLKFGRNIAFVGDNKDAAKYAGLNIRSIIIISFMLCAAFSFVAGMLGAALASNATPGMLQEYMLTAIAATVIGGTLMSGGRGNMFGTMLGAFFLSVIENGFLILGFGQWVLYLINGIVIIGTLSFRYIALQKE